MIEFAVKLKLDYIKFFILSNNLAERADYYKTDFEFFRNYPKKYIISSRVVS
jgi:hypothetical protein